MKKEIKADVTAPPLEKKKVEIASNVKFPPIVEERLDIECSKKKITWTGDRIGEKDIRELELRNLNNIIGWLATEKLIRTQEIMECELHRRNVGIYPDKFEFIIEEYKASPEIWRLKVY